MMKKTLSYLLILLVPILFNSCGYNTMVEKSELISEKWSQVETQYQRRADLIPNLVNTVKGYADFEKETLTKVIEARAKASSIQIDPSKLNAENLKEFQLAQDNLSRALSRLLVTVERYPELKANENFRDLQAQLEGTENRIAVARKKFNEAVKDYNTYIKKFPQLIIAKIFDFDEKSYFKAKKSSENAPKVKF